jgi:phosphatidylglycerophosphate synthase
MTGQTRRPIGARTSQWAQDAARWLTARNVSPDLISAASVGFALLAGVALWLAGETTGAARAGLLVTGAALVGARLLANMFDGMVAVEGGKGGPLGPLWNEAPDRIADVAILVGAGAGAAAMGAAPDWLGWLCACGALATAWVREAGARLTGVMDFSGPMAKPHRMFTVIAACFASLLEWLWGGQGGLMAVALWAVAILTWWTAWRRLTGVARLLRAAS